MSTSRMIVRFLFGVVVGVTISILSNDFMTELATREDEDED
jgi:hypothetical protein